LCWGAGPLAKGHRDHVVPFSFFRQTSSRRGKNLRLRIDLNADLGEAATEAGLAVELGLLPFLTSVNVACGGHAGDRESMTRTIRAASARGVAVGAHPSYSDRPGFGRRALSLPHDVVRTMVAEQISILMTIAAAHQVAVAHVKPHGALYNQAARDLDLALAIAEAINENSPALCLVGLAGSALVEAGRRSGLRVAAEAFADRAYEPDGSLVPRTERGAVLDRPEAAARQAVAIARDRHVVAVDGSRLSIEADTLCLHGDTPGAAAIAEAVRRALDDAAIHVVPLTADR